MHVPAHPYFPLALLGIWVALNAGLTHILRGVHGYGALFSGATAAIVVIPAVLTPGGSLELAMARVECTLIGVSVVTLVTGILTPSSPRNAFYANVRRVAGAPMTGFDFSPHFQFVDRARRARRVLRCRALLHAPLLPYPQLRIST